ncbi:MAG: AmmeMemoRadiSam system protein A [Nitrospirota bacterium]|jgi:AmmeMemoRadiSam system protein A
MHPLVRLAKESVEACVVKGQVLTTPEELDEEMQQKAGVFVCLKRGGELRGCIGTISPVTECLASEVIRNAIAASTEDPRFMPVGEEELDGLEYTVDVLYPPEPVSDLGELDPKKYGVIVSKGARRGLLLPDLEGVDTVEMQLHIAMQKAGISPGEEGVKVERFRVERYS